MKDNSRMLIDREAALVIKTITNTAIEISEKNNLKIGDKIKIKSNLFDADNEKGANEKVEVEIKGLFDGHNEGVF